MKHWKLLIFSLLCVFVLAALFLHPVSVVTEDTVQTRVLFGNSVELAAIAEQSGGYRCYLEDGAYFWLSADACTVVYGYDLCVRFPFRQLPILCRREP